MIVVVVEFTNFYRIFNSSNLKSTNQQLRQESRAVAGKPRDAAVIFDPYVSNTI